MNDNINKNNHNKFSELPQDLQNAEALLIDKYNNLNLEKQVDSNNDKDFQLKIKSG